MSPARSLRPVLYLAHWAKRAVLDVSAWLYLRVRIPELRAVDREISAVTGTRDRGYWKFVDLLRHLNRGRPAQIIEMGSGRTSFVFAWYARHHGAAYEALEQDAEWADLVNGTIQRRLGFRPVRHCLVQARPLGACFDADIAPDADFVYVDAPSAHGGPWQTHTGKAAYYDAHDHLVAGNRPRRIVIDGRTDSADLLLSTAASADYRFRGEFSWAIQRGKVRAALALRRHSSFELRRRGS